MFLVVTAQMILPNHIRYKPAHKVAHWTRTRCAYPNHKSLIAHRNSVPVRPKDTAILTASIFSIFKPMIRPTLALFMCASSIGAQAAILSDNSERRIEVREGRADTSSNTDMHMNMNSGDSMQGLIEKKQRQFEQDNRLSIEESKRVYSNKRQPTYNTTYNPPYSAANNSSSYNSSMDFNSWLNSNRYRAQQVANYQRYLSSQVGAQNVPPLDQLLTTARSWDKCGYESYQLPPQELWSNIVPTLRLYSQLKIQGILPLTTEIRSVYRSPGLNDCAGGASSSKHMTAGAIDVWVPEYEDNLWRLSKMQDSLCQFWQYQGESYNFGLGLYSTGAIHLDTQGYRKWGFNHASSSSSCRY
jgi:hypothetical protein